MKKIPFFDLKEQGRGLRKELTAAFHRSLAAADFILGGEVEHFEAEFARFVGARYAVGVNSGLDAISLSLRALGVGPGDEVIVPANSFVATALAVDSVGATPVFCDVRPDDLLVDLDSVRAAWTRRTRAVIPVHLYGQPVGMRPLIALARRKKAFVVEDACQAHGASIGRKMCGSFGDAAAFSFYPGKNLGALGDGGLITTNGDEVRRKASLFRNYGSVVKYVHEVAGFNTRLDAVQAAFLRVKLRRLAGWNRRRQAIGARYNRLLRGTPGLTLLPIRQGFTNAYHLYIIRVDDRDGLRKYLENNGIDSSIHYPVPIHRQGVYRGRTRQTVPLKVSEKEASRVLSLPLYPEMPLSDVDRVALAVRAFLR